MSQELKVCGQCAYFSAGSKTSSDLSENGRQITRTTLGLSVCRKFGTSVRRLDSSCTAFKSA